MSEEIFLKASQIIENNLPVAFLALYLISVLSSLLLFELFLHEASVIRKDEEMQVEREEDAGLRSAPAELVVEIAGAVNRPGVYKFTEEARVADLVGKGEGFREEASEVWISRQLNLSARLNDEQKIYIPFRWDEDTAAFKDTGVVTLKAPVPIPEVRAAEGSSNIYGTNPGSDEKSAEKLINVNQSTVEELESLNGIGPAYAGRIIANRPYQDLFDLEEKSGVPAGTIEKISDSLTF